MKNISTFTKHWSQVLTGNGFPMICQLPTAISSQHTSELFGSYCMSHVGLFILVKHVKGSKVKGCASSRWPPSLCCHMLNSDQMIIGKRQPTLVANINLSGFQTIIILVTRQNQILHSQKQFLNGTKYVEYHKKLQDINSNGHTILNGIKNGFNQEMAVKKLFHGPITMDRRFSKTFSTLWNRNPTVFGLKQKNFLSLYHGDSRKTFQFIIKQLYYKLNLFSKRFVYIYLVIITVRGFFNSPFKE